MNDPRLPSATEQLAILHSLQRILDEGIFNSSYKYALLHSIADLCLVKGDDSGAELDLSITEIAEQFVHLYWPQVARFVAGGHAEVLSQNHGRYEAAIVSELVKRHDRYLGSLSKLRRAHADWAALLHKIEEKVEEMPLWKLQTVGSEGSDFLYERGDAGAGVRLKPGIAYCFRVFYRMLTVLIQGEWTHFVNRLNHELLGQKVDLRSFLFPSRLNGAPLSGPGSLSPRAVGMTTLPPPPPEFTPYDTPPTLARRQDPDRTPPPASS